MGRIVLDKIKYIMKQLWQGTLPRKKTIETFFATLCLYGNKFCTMKRNKIVTISVLLVFSMSVISVAQKQNSTTKHPNVLFILADDLGINALNCYGNSLVESPNIDKLFSEGIHFKNGYSNDPTCAPSRGAIISGQYVPRHKIYRVADRYRQKRVTLEHMKYLPPENNNVKGLGKGLGLEKITIAEAFKNNGYTTAAYGKWHLGHGKLGIPFHGFDEGYEMVGHYNYKTDPKQENVDPNEYSADRITANTIDFMKRAVKAGKPFFSYVPFYLVHKPLEPKVSYLKHFQKILKNNPDVGPDEIKVLAMIKSLDESVGQLIETVKKLGIEENTIILFTSDNGHYRTESNIFTKPYAGQKGLTLEGGIRVPYIFKWKNHIPAGTVSKEPIIHVDIYPTLLGIAGLKPPKDYILDGEDLTPILLKPGTKSKRDALIWEYTNYANYNVKKGTFASEWVNVIQIDGYKLTEVVDNGKFILYNLNTDPYETTDIAATSPDIVKKLSNRLEKWKKEVGYVGPVPNPDYKY